MAARQLGVNIVLKETDLFRKEQLKPAFLKLNPFHKVPTIDDEGYILYESIAICLYLVNKFAPNSDLYPRCPKERGQVDKVLAAIGSTIQPDYFAFFRPRFHHQKKPTADEVKVYEEKVLGGLQRLIGDGKYAIGDNLTLADLSLMAHMATPLEVADFNPAKYPKLAAYYERLGTELPYFEEINRTGIEIRQKRWKLLQ